MGASCRSSLEPKWANSPLLLMASSLASRPMLSPSSPSTEARSAAARTIVPRVWAPWLVGCLGMNQLYSTNDRAILPRRSHMGAGSHKEELGHAVRQRQGHRGGLLSHAEAGHGAQAD